MSGKMSGSVLLPFTREVIDIIRKISPGMTISYGEVARRAGSPRAARQVARILHSCAERYNLPWQRVVGKGGVVLLTSDRGRMQRYMLEAEGVEFDGKGKVVAKYCL